MRNASLSAASLVGRPLLIEPAAAQALFRDMQLAEGRRPRSEGPFGSFLRNFGLGRQRAEQADRDGETANPVRPEAYAPLWAQQAYGEPTDEGFCWSLFNGVAALEIDGPIMARAAYSWWNDCWYAGYDSILASLRDAAADERVKALFTHIRSPGGVVDDGIRAISEFMRSARASAGGKPIWAYADTACSAAYWIAAQADRVVGPGVGMVGSIGAVMLHIDYSGADAQYGIVVTPIQFGAEKTAGASWAPLSASARTDWQAEIDQCGRNFVAEVAAGRAGLSPNALLATEARVFLGQHDDPTRSGLALGFLDAVMGEEEAFAELVAHVAAPSIPVSTSIAVKDPAMAHSQAEAAAIVAKIEGRITAIGAKSAGWAAKLPALRADPAKSTTATAILAAIGGAGLRQIELTGRIERIRASKAMDGDDADDEAEDLADEVTEDDPDENDPAKPAAGETIGAVDDADAIADSPEAKANPALALSAIRQGLSLAQFTAMAATAGPAKGGALREAMANARRLGADVAQPTGNRSALFEAAKADAQAKAAKATGR